MVISEIPDTAEVSLPASTCPYLVPLHERLILSTESLDLLVQLQVPLMIPLGHHVTGRLGGSLGRNEQIVDSIKKKLKSKACFFSDSLCLSIYRHLFFKVFR